MLPRIHDRYLLSRFLQIFAYSVMAFVLIYITVNVFEEIDNFIDHEASARNVVRYYLYSIPFVLTYVIPVSLLLGTVFAMGVMARRNELTALLASGVSITRIAAPIFAFALLVGVTSVYFNDAVVPRANRIKSSVKSHDIEGRERVNPDLKTDFRYLGAHGFVYLAQSYSHANLSLFDVVVQQFDNNTLVRRIDAKRARWREDHWLFLNGYERTFEGREEHVERFDSLTIPEITETPDDFAEEEIDEEDMTYRELSHYIDRVRRSGGTVDQYLVDLHFKFSFPFAGAIFVLIGVGLASGKRKPSIATGFGLTLVVAFLYYAVLRVGQTLGHNGVLPPLLAAQLGNIIFVAIGLWMLRRADR
ncbi:MAG TPA: LPS export ABC transporter permease LptG [Candidatus Krumholzibacteria bacterium]|nr:LPS export ABC transporter permease LptG [Candidatus Krumholzibacteria bacterium]